MPDRAVEEQDFLIGDRQVRERVQLQQLRLPYFVARVRRVLEQEVRVDDRGREEPERQQVRQDVADVTEVHRQRREQQGEAERQLQLDHHGEREDRELCDAERPLVV